MATTVEFVIKARDEATSVLNKLGTSLESVAKMGLEPIARISPTAANALGGLLTNLGPTALAVGALGGAAVAAVGGMFALTKSFADSAEKLDNMSAKYDVAVETLSSLRVAAELNETSLDAVGSAFNKMAKSIDAAAQGGKENIETFERLGVSINDLMQMNPEQQFETLAKAISELPNPTERVAVAMKVFGKSAAEIIPLLDDVANRGMAAVRKEAEELGMVMSGATARAANDFTDQLSRISLAGEGLRNIIGAALLPAFESMATAVLEGVKGLIAWEQETQVLSTTFTALGTILQFLGGLVAEVAKGFGFFLQVLKSIGTFIGDPTGQLEGLNAQIAAFDTGAKKAGPSATAMGTAMAGAATGAKTLESAIGTAVKALEGIKGLEDIKKKLDLAQFADQTATAITALETSFKAGKISAEDFAKASQSLSERLAEAQRTGIIPTTEAATKLGSALEKTAFGARELAMANLELARGELFQKFMEGKITVDKLHEGVQALNKEMEALKAKNDAGAESLTKVSTAATTTTEAFKETDTTVKAVGDSISATLFNVGAASESLMATLDELIKKGQEAQAAAARAVNVSGGIAGGLGGSGGGGGGGGIGAVGSGGVSPELTASLDRVSQGARDLEAAFQDTRHAIGGGGAPPMPPSGGPGGGSEAFAEGGVVRGAAHEAVPIIAHGGEVIGRTEQIVRAVEKAQRRMGHGGGGGANVVNIHPGAVVVQGTVVQAERDFATLTEHLAQNITSRMGRRR